MQNTLLLLAQTFNSSCKLFATVLLVFLITSCEKGKSTIIRADKKLDCSISEYIKKSKNDYINKNTAKPIFDFEYTYSKSNAKKRFSRDVSEHEQTTYYNYVFDWVYEVNIDDRDFGEKYRFDKRFANRLVPIENYKYYEVKLEYLINKCIYIASNDLSFLNKNSMNFGEPVLDFEPDDKELRERIRPHRFSQRMFLCSDYLYRSNNNDSSSIKYDISDFGYLQKSTNNSQIEKLYEDIYLTARAAGLIRKLRFLYYPKSLLKKHLKINGADEFIRGCKKTNVVNDDELAAKYFGSYERWIDSLNIYLDVLSASDKY